MAQQSSGKDGGANLNPFQLSGSPSSTNLFGATSGNSLFGKTLTSTPSTQHTGLGTPFSNTFTEGQTAVERTPFGMATNTNVGNFASSFSTPSTQVHSGGLFTSSVGSSTAVSSAQISSFGHKGFASGLKGNAFGTTNFGVSSSAVTGSGTFLSNSSTTDSSSLFGNTTTSMPSTIFGNPLSSTSFQSTSTPLNDFGKDGNRTSLGTKQSVFSGGVGFGTTTVMSTASQPDTGYGNFGNSQISSDASIPFSTPQPLPFSGAFVSKANSSEKDHGSTTVPPEIQRPFQGVDFNRPKTVQGISSVFGGAKDETRLFGGLSNNGSEKIVNLGNKEKIDENLRPSSISSQKIVGQPIIESSFVPSSSIPFHGSAPPTPPVFGGASSNTFVSGKVFSKTEEKKSYSDSRKSLFEYPSTEIEEGEIQDEQDDNYNRYHKTTKKQKGLREDQLEDGDEDIGGVFQSPESSERKSITKIIVVQIPDSCLDKEMLRLHFSRFGKVERVSLNETSKQATINFSDHDGASKAKRKGRKLHPKMPEVKIFYGTYVRRKSEDESGTKKILKEARRTARRSFSRENEMENKTRDHELDPYTPLERPGVQESRPGLRDNSVGNMMKRIKSKQALFQSENIKLKQELLDPRGSKVESYKPYNLGERDEMNPYIPIARPESLTSKPKKMMIQRDIPDDLSSVKFKRNKQSRAGSSDFHEHFRNEERDEMDPYIPIERPELSGSKSKKSLIQRDIPDELGLVKGKRSKQPRAGSPNFHGHYRVEERDEINPYNPIERPELSAQNIDSKSKKKVIRRDIPDDLSSIIKKKKNPQPRASSPSIRDKESIEVTNSTDSKLLEGIIRTQAQNNNSKHNILKARDRLIRPQIKRSGENLAATCPDMCPELERYKRDVQDYLSRYEKTNEVVDHRKVTKSFSRSSADKDEPLPWELRSGPVLSMTMDYLLCNILPRVDNEDEELKVWYGYLWDRTRAIRNDLMTQGLIDSLAVHVMERCCRFHMYCSIKFCDATVSTMDPKMNSEHLGKSLLTLKDLYIDMGEKGVYFETESEFRAYDMLLNLNSGNVMDQYVIYRDDVRRSKEVQYAVEVLHTVKTKNYVKFFKLVQQGTYLQGCILHRFFQQVRKDAIYIIMKAYHTQKQKIPLSKIVKILGFEDNEDAIMYLSYYGLECHSSEEASEDFVIIDKAKFIRKPSEIPPVVYPHRLIESSRNCSPAEVIQGGPLPKNPLDYHVPNDSFDTQGYLKKDSVNASDQLKSDNRSVEEIIDVNNDSEHQIIDERVEIVNVDHVSDSEIVETIEDEPKEIPALTNAEKIGYMKDIFDRVSSEIFTDMIPPVAQEAISVIKILYENEAEPVVEEFIFKNVTEEIRNVAVSVIKDLSREEHERLQQKLQEEKKKRRQLEELKSVAINSLLSDYVNQFVPELSNSIACEAIEQVEDETLQAVSQELEKELPLVLEEQVVKEEINTIAQFVINEALNQEEKVKEFQEKMNKRVCSQVFKKWRDLALLARRRKQSCEEFPARASQLSIEEQNNVLGWGYDRKSSENLGVTKITELYSTNELEMKKIMLLRDMEKKVAWFTLSIPSLLKDDIDNRSVLDDSAFGKNLLNHCFKILIITTPSVDPVVLQWLRAKLNPQVDADFTKPLKLCSSFVSRNTCLEYHVIMSETDLQVVYNDLHGESKGTNVAILVASEEDMSGFALQQMQCLLKDMDVPGTIIVTAQEASLSNDNIWYISRNDILDTETSERLQCLILKGWCGRNRNLSLHHNSFDDFVRNFIGDKVFDEAWKTHRERKSDYKSPLPINAYIVLYNRAIDHLIDVLKDKDLAYLSWPPMEASDLKGMPPTSWNGSTVEECTRWLKNGKLPCLNMEGYMTWDKIQSKVDAYISTIGLSIDASQLLLHEARRILESYMVPDEENCNWEIHVLSLPWIELTQSIASYMLNHIPIYEVYYQPKKLNQFTLPEAWYAACDSFDLSWIQGRGHPRTKKRKDCLEEPFQQAPKKTFKSELREAIEKEKEDCAKIEIEREKEIEAINEELRLIYGMEI